MVIKNYRCYLSYEKHPRHETSSVRTERGRERGSAETDPLDAEHEVGKEEEEEVLGLFVEFKFTSLLLSSLFELKLLFVLLFMYELLVP